jgi:hypothetical protein
MNETPQHLQQAQAIRRLAEMVEQHEELAPYVKHLSFTWHFSGSDAQPALSLFAEITPSYATEPIKKTHHDHDNGAQYSAVEAQFGPIDIRFQAHTEDVDEKMLGIEVQR